MNLVKTDIDSGGAAGTLEILTSDKLTVLAILSLSYPCGSVSGDTLIFGAITSDPDANATGTAAKARIKSSNGTVIIDDLTVGTSAAFDITLSTGSVNVLAGGSVGVSAGSITHAVA